MRETFLLVWQGAGVTLSLTALALIFAAPVGFYFAVLRVRGYRVGGSSAVVTGYCVHSESGFFGFRH